MAELTDKEQYINYDQSTPTALAIKIKEVTMWSDDAYAAAQALRDECDDSVQMIEQNISATGDRLAEFADELKATLFRKYYRPLFNLDKAIEEEIVDGHEIFSGDHFEDWIKSKRKEE